MLKNCVKICHHDELQKSIKANHYLKNNEMADLIDQLREAEDPFTCPHGRPIIINFSNYELEKLFKRVM